MAGQVSRFTRNDSTVSRYRSRLTSQFQTLTVLCLVAHDFFLPQPILNAAVFLLRVVLHDWPDEFARKILMRLRQAATADTKLLIADFILPLACHDDVSGSGELKDVEGAESELAPAPLLPNLGKASANVYWMDLTVRNIFVLSPVLMDPLTFSWGRCKLCLTRKNELFGNMFL